MKIFGFVNNFSKKVLKINSSLVFFHWQAISNVFPPHFLCQKSLVPWHYNDLENVMISTLIKGKQ